MKCCKIQKIQLCEVANFVCICITGGNCYHFRLKSGNIFRTQYKNIQNLQISQSYIFRILQHFATKFWISSNLKRFLPGVLFFWSRSKIFLTCNCPLHHWFLYNWIAHPTAKMKPENYEFGVPRWPPQDFRLIETMATSVATSVGNICWPNPQSTLDLEYQDGAGGFQNFIGRIYCMRDPVLFRSVNRIQSKQFMLLKCRQLCSSTNIRRYLAKAIYFLTMFS